MCTAPTPTLTASQRTDLLDFLSPSSRPDVRNTALSIFEGLSDSIPAIPIFLENEAELIRILIGLHLDQPSVRFITTRIFVNLTANDESIRSILTCDQQFVRVICAQDTLKNMKKAEVARDDVALLATAKLMSNLSRNECECARVVKELHDGFIDDAIALLTDVASSSTGDAFGYVLRNVTQLADCRHRIVHPPASSSSNPVLSSQSPAVRKICSLTEVEQVERRGIAVDILRNCCFDVDLHASLTATDDVLVALLRPIVGPEELTDEENDKLPIDLQYMQPAKQREPVAAIRHKLLEALYQLCSVSSTREWLRVHSVYPILREYHKWELNEGKSDEADRLVGNVIGLLIRTEEEIGVHSLHDVNQ